MIFAVLFICHCMGCAAYGIASVAQGNEVYGMFRPQQWWGCELRPWAPDNFGEAVITNTSVFKTDPPVQYELLTGHPRAPEGFCPPDEGRWIGKIEKGWLYLWVLYWTITTMTTIGYGDFSPLTPVEVGITIVVQLFGAVLFGWIIGNIATVVADFNQYETAYKLRLESIKTYLVHKKVPREMKKRVRKYCSHYYSRKGVMREDWGMLPPRLKRELIAFENQDFFDTFPRLLVPGCDEVLYKIADCLRPAAVPAGVFFVDAEMDPCTEIAFVADGEIAVMHRLAKQRSKKKHMDDKEAGKAAKSLTNTVRRLSLKGGMPTDPTAANTERNSGSEFTSPGVPGKPTLRRQDSSSFRTLGTKRSGTWFGHWELLEVYDAVMDAEKAESAMTADIAWHHSYKARVATELLLLVKDDFFCLLDEYPYASRGRPPPTPDRFLRLTACFC